MKFSFNGENPFFFASSKLFYDKKPKTFFPRESVELDYEELYEGEYDDNTLHDQIKTTVSSLDQKEYGVKNEFFYVIKSKVPPSDYGIEQLLGRLNADIVDYLDSTHQNFIVRGSSEILKKLAMGKKIPKIISDNAYQIRTINQNDQISKTSLKKLKENKNTVAIGILSTNDISAKETYFSLLRTFSNKYDVKITHSFFDEDVIFAVLNIDLIKILLEKSSFVHFIEVVPTTLVESFDFSDTGKVKTIPSGLEPLTKIYDKAKVVVLDTGITKIQPLEKLLLVQDSFDFDDNDDSDHRGHGTPVGSLVALGENLNDPKIELISYKIFENRKQDDKKLDDDKPLAGMIAGIQKYREQTRLFLSSLNFEEIPAKLESKLDKIIQKSNIVFVNSAGNIPPELVLEKYGDSGYPNYIPNFFVQSPSTCPSVVSVGSIAKNEQTKIPSIRSIANVGGIAPYSRCGTDNVFLFESKKPEVVENGANLNIYNNSINFDDVGTKSFDKHGQISDFYGTSFSAPLALRKISELETYYGQNIHNAETFKAIAYIGSVSLASTCSGVGQLQNTIGCDDDHALYYGEGTLSLRGETTTTYYEEPYSQITIKVPYSADRIDLCLVHSDYFQQSNFPMLNTYLKVDAYKTARASKFPPDNTIENDRITNIKLLTYSFQSKSMEGDWTFKIYPQLTAKIASRYKKDILIRYGIALLISRRRNITKKISMNQEIQSGKY